MDKLPRPSMPRIRGRFQPGHSGNPAGRPPRARNRSTLFLEALRSGDPAKARSVIERAKEGDIAAIKACFKIMGAPRRADRAQTPSDL